MSVRDAVFQRLAADAPLVAMLAKKPADVVSSEAEPAIYDSWAAAGTPKPYINLSYQMGSGGGLAKRSGLLNVDIFTEGSSTLEIEAINERVKQLLNIVSIYDPDDGPIRLYLDTENEVPEPEDNENIKHWNTVFTVIHWQRSFLARRFD